MMYVTANQSDVSIYVPLITAAGATASSFVASDVAAISYVRDLAAPITVAASDLSSASATHSDGGIYLVAGGILRIDLPDAAFVAGSAGVRVTVEGLGGESIAAGLAVIEIRTSGGVIDANLTHMQGSALPVSFLNGAAQGLSTMASQYINQVFQVHNVTGDVTGIVRGNSASSFIGVGVRADDRHSNAISTFDHTTDTVGRVALVDATTANADMRGTDGANTIAPDNASIAAAATSAEAVQAKLPADGRDMAGAGDVATHLDMIDSGLTTEQATQLSTIHDRTAQGVTVSVGSHIAVDGQTLELVQGEAYLTIIGNSIDISLTDDRLTAAMLTDGTVPTLRILSVNTTISVAGVIAGYTAGVMECRFEVTRSQSAALSASTQATWEVDIAVQGDPEKIITSVVDAPAIIRPQIG